MRVTLASRLAAAAAYPALIVGAGLVALLRKDDAFSRAHAKTSAGLTVACAFSVVAWTAAMEFLSFVPYVGFPTAIAFAAIVAALCGYCCLMSVIGIVRALLGLQAAASLIDSWFERLIIGFKRLFRARHRGGRD